MEQFQQIPQLKKKSKRLLLIQYLFHERKYPFITTQTLFSVQYCTLFGIQSTLGTLSRSTKFHLMELAFTSVIYPTIISTNTKSTSLNSKHKHIIMNYSNARTQKNPTPNGHLKALFGRRDWFKKYKTNFQNFKIKISHPSRRNMLLLNYKLWSWLKKSDCNSLPHAVEELNHHVSS